MHHAAGKQMRKINVKDPCTGCKSPLSDFAGSITLHQQSSWWIQRSSVNPKKRYFEGLSWSLLDETLHFYFLHKIVEVERYALRPAIFDGAHPQGSILGFIVLGEKSRVADGRELSRRVQKHAPPEICWNEYALRCNLVHFETQFWEMLSP